MNTRKRLNKQHTGYQLAKWGFFIPSIVLTMVYSISILVELISIKATKTHHTKQEVEYAKKWFLYNALPFFGEEYFFSLWSEMNSDQIKSMLEIYGKRSFSKRLKMYVPFMPKMNAFDAYYAKTGNSFEIVQV